MFLFAEIAGLFVPVALVGLIILGILAVVGGRADHDPAGHRPYTVYLTSVDFVALFTLLFAVFGVVSALANLAFGPEAGTDCPVEFGGVCPPPESGSSNDLYVRQMLQFGVTAVAAALLYWFHDKRLRALRDDVEFLAGAGRRPYVAYLYLVCFVLVVTLLIAGALALYGLFRVALPDITAPDFGGDNERETGLVQLLSSVALAGASAWLFRMHWAIAERIRSPAPPPPAVADEPTITS